MGNCPPEYLRSLEDKAHLGDRFQDFLSNGAYDLLNKYVFEPIENKAFDDFKKADPSDMNVVIQTQKISQAIDRIRQRINSIIEEGKNARNDIKQNTVPEEDQ